MVEERKSRIRRKERPTNIDPERRGLVGGIYKPLTKKEVKKIHGTALKILRTKNGGGILCPHERILEIYAQGGARVNRDNGMVWLPSDLVDKYVRMAPRRVIMGARNPQHDLILEGHRVYCGSGGAPTHVLRLGDDTPHLYDLQDLINTAILCQNLKHLHFYLRSGEIPSLPVGEIRDVNKVYHALSNTEKHVMVGYLDSGETAKEVIRMGKIVAGSKKELRRRSPLSVVICWMTTPRVLDPAVADVLIEVVKEGLPVALSSDPMMGATAPPTQAGTLAQLHAEQLSGIVLVQMIHEQLGEKIEGENQGAPVLPGYVIGVFNRQSAGRWKDPRQYHKMGGYEGFLGGSIEGLIMNAAVAQLAHSPWVDVPVYNTSGLADTLVPTIQSGIEKGIGIALSAMSGVNYIHHAAGLLENMNIISYEQYVLDNEIIGMVMQILRGIRVDQETLALDVMLRTGPGGSFFDEPETAVLLPKETLLPSTKAFIRMPREDWEAIGRPTTRQLAQEVAREILETAEPVPLPKEIDQQIRREFGRILVEGRR